MNEKTPTQQVSEWLADLDAALARGDTEGAAALFGDDSYWRDLVAFTWNITTAEGNASVRQMIAQAVIPKKPSAWQIEGEASEAEGVIEGWLRFETEVARGCGHVRLIGGRAWTLLTTMTELKGYEERRGPTRERGVEHGVHPGRKTWLEQRRQEEAELGFTRQPYVVIIGGGQGGIALGARLRRLNVPTIILEKHERPGDFWRKRYKTLCLHDPVWYDHLPYLPFPDHWPVFCPKDKIADWLEMYTKVMELNYWGSAECKRARYDEANKEWTVEVVRNGQPMTLRPRQLVFATGSLGVPNMPTVPGMEKFKGDLHHSSQHPGPDGYRGKKAVVIGSNTSAHDICAALWEEGADVTMVQRRATLVVRTDTLLELGFGPLYSEAALQAGITTERADLIVASRPYRTLPALQIPLWQEIKKRDAEFYARLEKVGFQLDFGEDESGLSVMGLRRGGGFYIDVGASDLVADGRIKLKSRVGVERIEEHSIVLTDGSELPADLIVFATGYGSMNGWVEQLVSKEVADKVGKCWGLGSGTRYDPGPWEGELRNMWKPTHQEGLWFHGGNLHLSRHYSQYLALQLKARMEGIPTPVYGMGPVYHTS
ncbi:MAG TPA: NAD(P)/FAD-dependent oxidoreductase [Chthonomonadaceae bacterium]|nr:NAD(P)/FAD-dependent oxidoreductase [Chthonomonadaceae bacterium]